MSLMAWLRAWLGPRKQFPTWASCLVEPHSLQTRTPWNKETPEDSSTGLLDETSSSRRTESFPPPNESFPSKASHRAKRAADRGGTAITSTVSTSVSTVTSTMTRTFTDAVAQIQWKPSFGSRAKHYRGKPRFCRKPFS